jgi:hypothetical protein
MEFPFGQGTVLWTTLKDCLACPTCFLHHQPAMALAAVKETSKKIVDYPDHNVEVVSTKDWLSRFWTNPFPHVRRR